MDDNADIRILVTGGSGFIGTNTIDYLIENKYTIKNYDINPPIKKEHIDLWREVDIRDNVLLQSEMLNYKPTHILHLAAGTGMDVTDLSTLNANTEGVNNIIESSEKCMTVKSILFTSSLLVCKYGYIPNNDTDYCPPNLYGKSKVMSEEIIRNYKNPKFTWAIVRPTSVWGPHIFGPFLTFFKLINNGYYFHPGKKQNIKPYTFVGNTVFMMMKILFSDHPEKNRGTFYLVDYPLYSTKEWAMTIQNKLNAKTIITLPIMFLRSLALFGDFFKKITKVDPPLTNSRLDNMLNGGDYPCENTKSLCGELPYNIGESVSETVKWLKDTNVIK
jgi:GlcNAc-P-P-Und epimerase